MINNLCYNIFLMERKGIAVLPVDPQKDFTSEYNGALAVPKGAQIIYPLNRILDAARKKNYPIIPSREEHPNKGIHIDKWGPHCVIGTPGADFIPGLNLEGAKIFYKGTLPNEDVYSSFRTVSEDGFTPDQFLKMMGVGTIVVAGLATEYCVKDTVLEGLALGYRILLATDAIGAVNKFHPDDGEKALVEMKKRGAKLMTTDQILKVI